MIDILRLKLVLNIKISQEASKNIGHNIVNVPKTAFFPYTDWTPV